MLNVSQLHIFCIFLFAFCQLSESCVVTDRRVLTKLAELAVAGVLSVQEMQCHIQRYVVDDLFAGMEAPTMSDARYWPSSKVVLNCIYRAVKKTRLVFLSDNLYKIRNIVIQSAEMDHLFEIFYAYCK